MNNVDLLEAYHEAIVDLGPGYHRELNSADGFRIKESTLAGRSIFLRVNKGPEGGSGEAYHLDDDKKSITTGERQALLSGLRAMFVVPADSYYGLLFVERVGVRNLKQLLSRLVIYPVGEGAEVVTRIESYAEASDWRRDLRSKQALRISELMEVRTTASDGSTANDTVVRVNSEGGLINRLGTQIKELVLGRIEQHESHLDATVRWAELEEKRVLGGSQNAFTVQDETEYQRVTDAIAAHNAPQTRDANLTAALSAAIPVTAVNATHRKFEVGLGDDQQINRKFVIEGDSMPQFVFELGARLQDSVLRSTWVAHAEKLMRARGVTLPAGWDR